MTINWTQHGTNDFLGQILARGNESDHKRRSRNNALNRMGDWCGFLSSVTKKPENTGAVNGINAFGHYNFFI